MKIDLCQADISGFPGLKNSCWYSLDIFWNFSWRDQLLRNSHRGVTYTSICGYNMQLNWLKTDCSKLGSLISIWRIQWFWLVKSSWWGAATTTRVAGNFRFYQGAVWNPTGIRMSSVLWVVGAKNTPANPDSWVVAEWGTPQFDLICFFEGFKQVYCGWSRGKTEGTW